MSNRGAGIRMAKFIAALLMLVALPFLVAQDDCGYKADGQYHCGTHCGYKADGKFHCGTECGYKSDGNFHCEGDN